MLEFNGFPIPMYNPPLNGLLNCFPSPILSSLPSFYDLGKPVANRNNTVFAWKTGYEMREMCQFLTRLTNKSMLSKFKDGVKGTNLFLSCSLFTFFFCSLSYFFKLSHFVISVKCTVLLFIWNRKFIPPLVVPICTWRPLVAYINCTVLLPKE